MNTFAVPPTTFGIHSIASAIKSTAHEAPTSKTTQRARLILKNFFASWNHFAAPSLRAYILENVYDFPELEGCVDRDLMGSDRAILACLQPLAAAFGFELYLAEVEYAADALVEPQPRDTAYEFGHVGFDSDYDYKNGSDSEWQSDHASEMDGVMAYHYGSPRKYVYRSYVVDTSGMPVNVSLGLHLNNSFIINGKIDSGEPTKKNFARDDEHYKVLTYIWVKSLILIVPKWSELEITTGDIFRYTVNSLRASNSRTTNEKETKHLDTLLRASTAREVRLADSLRYGSWQEIETARRKHIGDLQTAFLTVIDVSMRWSDVDIFLRFAHACKVKSYDGVIVDSATLVAIYEAIPASWCKLKDFFADFAFNLPSNSMRTNFLEITANVAKEQGNFVVVKEWCRQQDHVMMASIKTLKADEVDWMCSVIVHEDCMYFRDMIFPQLQSQLYNASVWMPLIEAIHSRKAENTVTVNLVVAMSIQHAVEETLAYLCTPYNESVYCPPGLRCGSRLDSSLSDPSAITKLVLLCIKVAHPDQCAVIFNRMAPENKLGFEEFASWKYYEALVLDMATIADAHPELKPTFSIFFTNAISELVCHRKQDGWEPVVVTLKHCEDDHLAKLFNPGFIASLEEHLIKVVARVLYEKVYVAASQSSLSETVTWCLEEIVRKFLKDRRSSWTSATPVSIVDLLDFAYSIGCGDTLSQNVLRELVSGISTVRDEDLYVNTKLAPLVFGLCRKMAHWQRSFAEPPFVTFCADTLKLFARHCMPATPTEPIPVEILAFGCGTSACLQCRELRHFLCLSSQEVYRFTGVDNIRNHLEHQLQLSSALKYGVSFYTVKASRPFTLQVIKPSSMIVHGKFAQQKQTGLDMLSALGDTAAQRHALGEAFDWVFGTIMGTCTPPAAPEESSHKRGSDGLDAEALVLKRARVVC